MRKFPVFFDEMICSLILTGEKSGTLDTMLKRIAEHKERSYRLKSKIRQALFYPIMILIVAILITIIMLLFVVPRFTELFQNMHATLPVFTLSVIHFANFLKNDWPIIILAWIILTTWFYYAKRFPRTRFIIDAFQLKIPVIGLSLQKYILASWARSLTTLFAAGIPITEALKMLTHSMHNLVYRNAVHELYLHISAGKQLHLAVQRCKLFPPMMVHMIQIGEESGTLETMLTKIADFYEADLDQMISYLSKMLEPLIMVILGVVIGGLVIAMYLPIFKLGDVI
jgi:type IV pilus assembly protein PilC